MCTVPVETILEPVKQLKQLPSALAQVSGLMGRATELDRELGRLRCCHGVEIDQDLPQVTVWQFDHSNGSFGLRFSPHYGYPNGQLECSVVNLVGEFNQDVLHKYIRENKGFNRITNICACVREYCKCN